jgi:hypothetical protein
MFYDLINRILNLSNIMKKAYFLIEVINFKNALFWLLIVMTFFSCTKEIPNLRVIEHDSNFIVTETSNDILHIKNILLKKNPTQNNIANYVKQFGNPLWTKVVVLKNDQNPEYIIPFQKESNEISALLLVKKISENYHYKFINGNIDVNKRTPIDFKNNGLLIYVNNLVFGRRNFKFSTSILNSTVSTDNKSKLRTLNVLDPYMIGNNYNSVSEYVEICITTNANCTCPSHYTECDMCSDCLSTQCWGSWVNSQDEVLDPNTVGGSSSGDFSGGGSGGGVITSEIIPDPQELENYFDNTITFEDDLMTILFDYNNDIWPTIPNVISIMDFVGYTSNSNCLTLAKNQIAKLGLSDLGYSSSFKVFDAQGGPYPAVAKQGVNYIISKLQQQKPVIVGVNNHPGTVGSLNADGKTDHFVTIVGAGQDSKGKYFRFYDNASNLSSQGANSANKLYYSEITGLIKGQSHTSYGFTVSEYEVTQIRKNN